MFYDTIAILEEVNPATSYFHCSIFIKIVKRKVQKINLGFVSLTGNFLWWVAKSVWLDIHDENLPMTRKKDLKSLSYGDAKLEKGWKKHPCVTLQIVLFFWFV